MLAAKLRTVEDEQDRRQPLLTLPDWRRAATTIWVSDAMLQIADCQIALKSPKVVTADACARLLLQGESKFQVSEP